MVTHTHTFSKGVHFICKKLEIEVGDNYFQYSGSLYIFCKFHFYKVDQISIIKDYIFTEYEIINYIH